MSHSNFVVHTFGCKVNTYDSGLIQKNMKGFGSVATEGALVHILNTCAVTAEATKEAVRTIRKIKSKAPLDKIVVTGCSAQVDSDSFTNLPGVDLIVANSHKSLLPELIDQMQKGLLKEKVFRSNIFRHEDLGAGGGEELGHSRSFLKIQDGCNSFCTFCIIPYARGKSRSIPVKELVRRVDQLHGAGFQEVVLTGVHIGDYADEDGNRLPDLVREVLRATRVPRIRLTSLEPIELTPELMELYSDSRMCPHFHMSIQSASTPVLKEMKRHYSSEQVFEALHMIQRVVPGAFVGMDVIAGFPTETEDTFLETYRVLSKSPWSRLHVFPYSQRPGTRAAILPQVDRREILHRARRLRELSQHRLESLANQQLGRQKKVLLQNKLSKGGHGLSEDYWNIRVLNLSEGSLAGTVAKVKVIEAKTAPNVDPLLLGELL